MRQVLFCCMVATIAAISYAINVKTSLRIAYGTDAVEGEFPYAVSLRSGSNHVCGGTILNEKFVLTAAHCTCDEYGYPLADFTIQYGVLNVSKTPINIVKVSNVICNDYSFTDTDVKYDAAVLELENPLPMGSWAPVKLAREFDTLNGSRNGTIIGWGKTENDVLPTILQKLNVEIYNDTICRKVVDLKHNICFGAVIGGACPGDSGGALIVDGVQVGIASYITNNCGKANATNPNVYARISTYYDWIKEQSYIGSSEI